ncbi:glycosyltransferase family 9 protein [Serratia sp. root2]|uniref:glycosyltransferase family 9 protein n=1 Tax=Serratia sp. root2 TaxID=3059676 RepID=UPI00288DE7D2|nr:glycosyltransferase family 9 protein [Serratia sp. root2]MDT3253922.1 glycosyltransferase family 9 protein [Serratia sp. root2]
MKLFGKVTRVKNLLLRKVKLRLLISWCLMRKRGNRSFEPASMKKVLLLRLDDKIGDMVVATGVIKKLADSGHQVSILSGAACKNMLSGVKHIAKFYIYQRRESLRALKKQHFDVVIDFDDVTTYERCRLIYKLGARHTIGFNKQGYPMYDTSIDFLDAETHVTERHKRVLRLLGVGCAEYCYDLEPTPASVDKVSAALAGLRYNFLVAINPFTGSADKDLSRQQTQDIISLIKSRAKNSLIVLIGQESKVAALNMADCIYIPGSTVNTAVEIVKRADLIISPDTSIVHMACAFNKRLVAIYNQRKLKDTGLPGHVIWSPNYGNAVQIVTEKENVSDVPVEVINQQIGEQIALMENERSLRREVAL